MSDRQEKHTDATLNVRQLIWQTVLAILIFGAILLALAAFYGEELEAVGKWFVMTFGGPGLALALFIPDAFTVPLPHEAFMTFAHVGKLGGFWTITFWASVGSLSGGCVGFGIGRMLRNTRRFKALMNKHGAKARKLIERYGVAALAAGAVTPLPYSIMCWTCGALEMPFPTFMLVSLLRVPRIMFYLWLITQGVSLV